MRCKAFYVKVCLKFFTSGVLMDKQELMQKILEQQLAISREMRKRLEAVMTEALEAQFNQNEAFLLELLESATPSADDLKKLDETWEVLNKMISEVTANLQKELDKRKKAAPDEEKPAYSANMN